MRGRVIAAQMGMPKVKIADRHQASVLVILVIRNQDPVYFFEMA